MRIDIPRGTPSIVESSIGQRMATDKKGWLFSTLYLNENGSIVKHDSSKRTKKMIFNNKLVSKYEDESNKLYYIVQVSEYLVEADGTETYDHTYFLYREINPLEIIKE